MKERKKKKKKKMMMMKSDSLFMTHVPKYLTVYLKTIWTEMNLSELGRWE